MTDNTTNLEEALNPTEQQPEEPKVEAPEAPTEEVKAEEEPKAPVEKDDGGITVPLKALHEVRDANKVLRAEMEALKQAAQPQPEPVAIPDPIEDPQGFADYTQNMTAQQVAKVEEQFQNRFLNMSEANAVKVHGAEAVESVKEWFAKQSPDFIQQTLGQVDPYDYAIQEQKRQSLTEQLTADPDKLDRVLRLLEGKEEPKPAPVVPATTATHQSVGTRAGPQWSGPTPLEQVL